MAKMRLDYFLIWSNGLKCHSEANVVIATIEYQHPSLPGGVLRYVKDGILVK